MENNVNCVVIRAPILKATTYLWRIWRRVPDFAISLWQIQILHKCRSNRKIQKCKNKYNLEKKNTSPANEFLLHTEF